MIFNFSNRLISDEEKEILSRGLNFCIPPKRLDHCNFLTPFELFYRKLKQEPIGPSSRLYPDFIKTKLKDIVLSQLRSYCRPSFVFSEEELKVLNDLRNYNNIIILKLDKGNGIVILDKNDYKKKMEDIISDTDKFRLLHDDPTKLTLQRENKIKHFLCRLKKSKSITQTTYKKLFPTGSQIGILYGLPKIHRSNIPLRPILSSVNKHSYNIAKFLVPLLRPIASGAYMVSDSLLFRNYLI